MFPLLVFGCTASDPTFTFTLTPVEGNAPDPYEGIDRYELVVDPGGPSEVRIPMDVAQKMASGVNVPPLNDVRVAVEGFSGDALRLRGLTERLTAKNGHHEAQVFVARAGSTTWLPDLSDGTWVPVVAALGDGRFWIGGGATNNFQDEPAKGMDDILDLHLAPPDEGLAFASIGSMPEYEDADGEMRTVRMGASLTPLTVAGADAGKLLLAGGATADPLRFDGQSTRAASLYDPATGTWEDIAGADAMHDARLYHLALENTLGTVIIAGGIGEATGTGATLATSVEVYTPAERKFGRSPGDLPTGQLDLFATNLGEDGTLFCGGGRIDGSSFEASSECARIPLAGDSIQTFQSLPAELVGSAMVALDNGAILLTGGATTSGPTNTNVDLPARADAWLYSPSTESWGALSASMAMPRATHQMTRLADGRVLIVGGAESYNMDTVPADGLSCLEIFDPADNSFTSVDGCTSADDSGGLPARTPRTMLANDPEFGVLIVGGVGIDGRALSNVSLFVPGE